MYHQLQPFPHMQQLPAAASCAWTCWLPTGDQAASGGTIRCLSSPAPWMWNMQRRGARFLLCAVCDCSAVHSLGSKLLRYSYTDNICPIEQDPLQVRNLLLKGSHPGFPKATALSLMTFLYRAVHETKLWAREQTPRSTLSSF